MAVTLTQSVELNGEFVTVKVQPKKEYSLLGLRIKGRGADVELLLDEEQLAEIEYAIQRYRGMTRAHESPDQDLIYQHELEKSIEEESHETHRAS